MVWIYPKCINFFFSLLAATLLAYGANAALLHRILSLSLRSCSLTAALWNYIHIVFPPYEVSECFSKDIICISPRLPECVFVESRLISSALCSNMEIFIRRRIFNLLKLSFSCFSFEHFVGQVVWCEESSSPLRCGSLTERNVVLWHVKCFYCPFVDTIPVLMMMAATPDSLVSMDALWIIININMNKYLMSLP